MSQVPCHVLLTASCLPPALQCDRTGTTGRSRRGRQTSPPSNFLPPGLSPLGPKSGPSGALLQRRVGTHRFPSAQCEDDILCKVAPSGVRKCSAAQVQPQSGWRQASGITCHLTSQQTALFDPRSSPVSSSQSSPSRCGTSPGHITSLCATWIQITCTCQTLMQKIKFFKAHHALFLHIHIGFQRYHSDLRWCRG